MGDEELKKYMPAVLYKEIKDQFLKVSKQEDAGACVVCLCDFEDNENIRSTYCKHVFHSDCLTDWMKKNESCPYCRAALKKDNIAEIYEKHQSNSLMWLNQEINAKNNSKDKDGIQEEEQNQQDKQGKQETNQIFINRNSNRVDSQQNPNASQSDRSRKSINLQADQAAISSNKRDSVQQQHSHRSSIKQSTIIKEEVLQNFSIEINKEPRKEEADIVLESTQQQDQGTLRSQEENNFQSQENVNTTNKFNNESSSNEQPGQFVFSNFTPGRDNSILEYKRNLSTQQNDSFLNEGQTSSKRSIIINQVKNSLFKNNVSSEKKSLNSNDNDEDQSYNQEIKLFQSDLVQQVLQIDPESICDKQVQRINADYLQSENSTYYPRESEDIFGGGSVKINSSRAASGLQVIYSESSSPNKLQKPNMYSFRYPQTTINKRKNNSKKNTQISNVQSKNASIQSIYKKEENKELRKSLKDFEIQKK